MSERSVTLKSPLDKIQKYTWKCMKSQFTDSNRIHKETYLAMWDDAVQMTNIIREHVNIPEGITAPIVSRSQAKKILSRADLNTFTEMMGDLNTPIIFKYYPKRYLITSEFSAPRSGNASGFSSIRSLSCNTYSLVSFIEALEQVANDYPNGFIIESRPLTDLPFILTITDIDLPTGYVTLQREDYPLGKDLSVKIFENTEGRTIIPLPRAGEDINSYASLPSFTLKVLFEDQVIIWRKIFIYLFKMINEEQGRKYIISTSPIAEWFYINVM